MQQRENSIKRFVKGKSSNTTPRDSLILNTTVTRGKDESFKLKCESAVESTGLTKIDFYQQSKISRQRWYFWSWGLEAFPGYIKIRLCDLFGKPFRDLFLGVKK